MKKELPIILIAFIFILSFFYTADCISISNFGNEYLRHLP